MAYKGHRWDKGELITSEKLNHMESGIAEALGNALIGRAIGSGQVTAEDAAVAPLVNLTIAGKSGQVVTTGAQPSPSPAYPQPIISTGDNGTGVQLLLGVLGENLYDYVTAFSSKYTVSSDGIITSNITSDPREWGYGSCDYKTELAAGEYTLSIEWRQKPEVSTYGIGVFRSNGIVLLKNSNLEEYTFILDEADDIGFMIKPYTSKFKVSLIRGNKTLSWRPYQSQHITIPLTEPLRGLGEYQDRIMCKDGEWGVERQCLQDNIASVDEAEKSYFRKNVESYHFKSCSWDAAANAICDHLTVVPYNNPKDGCIAIRSAAGQTGWGYCLHIGFVDQTIAAYNAWLAEHAVSVVTVLAAPTWKPFPAETQSALNALTAYQGRTTITVTAGGPAADVGLEYVRDINTAIADLQAQIEALKGGTHE